MKIIEVPDGARGFDCNAPLSAVQARAAVEHGYTFVVRYIRRMQRHPHDLTMWERDAILAAGLGLAVVQHVESEVSWLPSLAKGHEYGATASSEAAALSLPVGTTVACDLEGVTPDTASVAVIEYCRAWWTEVDARGFLPCLYVGWHAGLTPAELYALPFTRYWGALNLNADEFPAVRGLCLKQHEEKSDRSDRPVGVDFAIDTDTAMMDAKGGRLTMVVA